ncbi:MAG: hypothetical protein LBL94_02465 [Prevotellaceae bacterium]|jgi:hypothetical protein|nr:hypothetical protein [Prevotellaceae bacterium]
MKWLIFSIFILLSVSLYGEVDSTLQPQRLPNMAVNRGFLMGGGAMYGADVEYLFAKNRWGVQVGAGLISFGAGINYHLKPRINSSFISVQYWEMWLAPFVQMSFIAPMFVFRTKSFQAGVGCGIALPQGYFTGLGGMPVPLFNVGSYLPFSSKRFTSPPSEEASASSQKNKAVSVGVGMGGGSLGADVEYLVSGSRWGAQAGAGLKGVSAGVNCHLKPSINSSFASVQYWHWQLWQPGGATIMAGPLLVYRAPKYFQAGLGLSYALYHGADVYASEKYKYYWLFNIGAYFPW